MLKRIFDITASLFGLIFLSPIFLIIIIWIKIDSKGPIFYKQERVGKDNINFKLFKFRSMRVNSDKKGLLTLGDKDTRITNSGFYIRKYKIDELPQLLNVIIGDMSFVGPRPEVRRYVEYYTMNQMEVLKVRPGITDVASIAYRNESEILKSKSNPEEYYIDVIMQDKLALNIDYIKNKNLLKDINVIFKTLIAILK